MSVYSDYFLVIDGYQNEFLSTGFIRKATILVTPKSIYAFPFDASFTSWTANGTGSINSFSVTTEGFDVKNFIGRIPEILKEKTIDEVEAYMSEHVPKDWQFEISKLKLLKMSIRLGVLGTIKLKRKIGKKKIFFVSPENLRILSQRIKMDR